MKKITKQNKTQSNKRGLTARCVSAIVCFALLLMGATAFAAPVNDNFANATEIPPSPPATVTGDNIDASSEGGEPNHSPSEAAGGRSVWWHWTPAASGNVTITTGGSESISDNSGLDTQLAVYTGSSLNNLALVANNEDSVLFTGGRSAVTIPAVAGTKYYIAVDGWDGEQGNINLNFSAGGTTNPPPTGLTLTVTTTGSGTVTRDVAQPTGGYDTNTVVTLTAVPSGTNTFVTWGGDAAAFGSTNPISITMDANKTVTATFTGSGGGGGSGTNILTVVVNGNGRVTPNLDGRTLVIGKNYRMTARPGKDQLFSGWTGVSSNAENPRLTFAMQEGMVITANFAQNPFADTNNPVTGTYTGLLFDTNAITQGCSGNFTLKVQKNGRFSIRINKGGKTSSVTGQFDETGAATATIGKGTNAATVQLQLDMIGGSDTVTGTYTAPDCNATIEGDRQVFNTRHNPAPLAGLYTLLLPRDTNTVNGNGFATLNINKAGKVRVSGELADGTKFSQSTTISKDGQVPVYIPLYKKQGSLIGWLSVTETNASGIMSWIKPGVNGFEVDIPAVGSRFNSTASPLIVLNNGTAELGGGSLTTPLTAGVALNGNAFTVAGTNENKLNLRIAKNGTVQGNFINPNTGKRTPIRGVVLQNANSVNGFFLDGGTTGYLNLSDPVIVPEPEPEPEPEVVP